MKKKEENKPSNEAKQEKKQKPIEKSAEELHQSHNKLFVEAFKHKQTIIDYLTTFFPKERKNKAYFLSIKAENARTYCKFEHFLFLY